MENKLETYHGRPAKSNESVHGLNGPVHISEGGYVTQEANKDLFAAGEAVGEPETADLNDFTSVGGFAVSTGFSLASFSKTYFHSAGFDTLALKDNDKMLLIATCTL